MKKTEPIYIQLMNNIKHKITSGEYRVGDKIMSERDPQKRKELNIRLNKILDAIKRR